MLVGGVFEYLKWFYGNASGCEVEGIGVVVVVVRSEKQRTGS